MRMAVQFLLLIVGVITLTQLGHSDWVPLPNGKAKIKWAEGFPKGVLDPQTGMQKIGNIYLFGNGSTVAGWHATSKQGAIALVLNGGQLGTIDSFDLDTIQDTGSFNIGQKIAGEPKAEPPTEDIVVPSISQRRSDKYRVKVGVSFQNAPPGQQENASGFVELAWTDVEF